ncbi:methyltransferase domain-containing protein [Brucella anthropi]|uniref:methyltransferase domain-containing protein n=1 Tax=Brucella anthropi TaxID=529 RepID=UPI00125D454D|nr:methyltransferase domain-containing protein [Brucella anthropi]QFP62250.1 methyltransferase domain-containing protein [Brucella anthropi]
MLNQFNSYDHQFDDHNVYGSALALLKRNQPPSLKGELDEIHFDIGCGYGRIAEHISVDLGRHYVGIDGDETSLAVLSERGFETHNAMLTDFEGCLNLFRKIIARRRVASITMLDVLEHLPNGDDILRAIWKIASEHGSVVVISVPNVAHQDIGFRLAFGEWAYTQEGLLDHTHTRLFSEKFFTHILNYNGLHPIDQQNVTIRWSDQHFPTTHPTLASGTVLHQLLTHYRDHVDGNSHINQFVFCCVAGAKVGERPYLEIDEGTRPFLSIVMRTQGTRAHTMVEAFTALAAQTNRDFEVLVVGHKLSLDKQKVVERLIEDNPVWLREKIRFVRVEVGNRTHPLNVGFGLAEGEYISILDDDDVPFAHWIETFKSLADKASGRVLRAVAAKQSIVTVAVNSLNGIRAVDTPECYPSEFDLFDHLRENATPPVSVAFPRGVFENLNITFDENLTTTEDWDFMMRAILVVGVESSSKVTSIYHWWLGAEQSSRTDHGQEEWINNHHTILQKMDSIPLILPPKSAGKIRKLVEETKRYKSTGWSLRSDTLLNVISVLDSTSWRVSFPLRFFKSLLTRTPMLTTRTIIDLSDPELEQLLGLMYSSWSWRLTAPVRFFSRSRRTK